ncbi:MAG: hypothetical protein ACAI43_12410, partial [Phycisphaerae bacterium]
MPLIRIPMAVALALCAVLTGAQARAAEPGRPAATPAPHVVRHVSNSEDGPPGFRRPSGTGWVVVAPLEGGKAVRLNVSELMKRRLGSLSRGDLIAITLTASKPGGDADTVDTLAKAEGDKALADPRTYTVDGVGKATVAGQPAVTLRVSKFGQVKELVIPNRTTPGAGAARPDAVLLAIAESLKPGELVNVEFGPGPAKTGGTLIDAWRPTEPVAGTFVKLVAGKTADNKPVQQVVVDVDGKPVTYTLPSAAPAGAAPQVGLAVAALQATAKRLKPGYAVRVTLREAPSAPPATSAGEATSVGAVDAGEMKKETREEYERRKYGKPAATAAAPAGAETAPAVLRELRVDGRIDTPDERSLHVVSTWVRVEFGEPRRRRGFGAPQPADPNAPRNVEYHPEAPNTEAGHILKGVERVLESEDDARRAKVDVNLAKLLAEATGTVREQRPTGAELAQWQSAYTAWAGAKGDDARRKVEQEMLVAAQELSMRWRKEYEAAAARVRGLVKKEQVEELAKLGAEGPRTRGAGGPPAAPAPAPAPAPA